MYVKAFYDSSVEIVNSNRFVIELMTVCVCVLKLSKSNNNFVNLSINI